LESRGYIEQNKATENYRLGIRCLQIGQTYVTQMGLLRQAHPIIESLAHTARETAFVAVLRKTAAVPLDAVEADRPIRMTPCIGGTLPLHSTAAGKVQLAFIADADVRDGFITDLARFTERTITERQVLLDELHQVADQGYSIELGEHIEEVNSVAVPIRDYTRNVVGSLGLSGPAYRMSGERIDKELIPLMLKAGQELSSRLGFES
jgi:DNA-binding IclR family transcriptional regulator